MDKKELFGSLVYVDRDFIATAYEALCGVAPDTQVTKTEGKGAAARIPVFSANLSVTETRSFKTSTFGMLADIFKRLEAYPALDDSPLPPSGRSAIGWVKGELSVATIELRSDRKSNSQLPPQRIDAYVSPLDATATVFTLRDGAGLTLTLITSESYFTSGFGALLGMSEVVIEQASVPVRALVRVLDVKGSFDDWLAVPLLMLDGDRASSNRMAMASESGTDRDMSQSLDPAPVSVAEMLNGATQAVVEDPAERAKRLEWMEKQATDNIKARFATSEIIAKEAQTTLTVLLAGVAGSAAYASPLLGQVAAGESLTAMPFAFAVTCIYLTGLAIWLVTVGMRFASFPAAHQDPSNLLHPEAEAMAWSKLREEELGLVDERIKKAARINGERSRGLNWVRIAASLSPLVLAIAFFGAVRMLPSPVKSPAQSKTLNCELRPALQASGVGMKLACSST